MMPASEVIMLILTESRVMSSENTSSVKKLDGMTITLNLFIFKSLYLFSLFISFTL